jgi:hypothetical protein
MSFWVCIFTCVRICECRSCKGQYSLRFEYHAHGWKWVMCFLLGYDILSLGVWFWAFWDNVLLLSSRCEMSKKNKNFSWTFQPLKLHPSPTHPPTHFDNLYIHLSTSPCVCPCSDIEMILMVVHFSLCESCLFFLTVFTYQK